MLMHALIDVGCILSLDDILISKLTPHGYLRQLASHRCVREVVVAGSGVVLGLICR